MSNLLAVCQNGDTLDRALLREMLGYFMGENRRRVEELHDAAASDARDRIRQVAHAMRGSAAMLGAGRLHDLAWSLEMDADVSPRAEIQQQVARVGDEFNLVIATLRRRHPDATSEC